MTHGTPSSNRPICERTSASKPSTCSAPGSSPTGRAELNPDAPATPDRGHDMAHHSFLEGLASQDFDQLASALSKDVHLRALVPMGLKEWDGADQVKAAFTAWFGDVDEFELVDATVGAVGRRVHIALPQREQA